MLVSGVQESGSDIRTPGGTMIKNPPPNAEDLRDAGSIPWSGRSPGGGHRNRLQFSCLENSVDRGAWWASVHGGHKESDMTEHTHTHTQCLINSLQSFFTSDSAESHSLQGKHLHPIDSGLVTCFDEWDASGGTVSGS